MRSDVTGRGWVIVPVGCQLGFQLSSLPSRRFETLPPAAARGRRDTGSQAKVAGSGENCRHYVGGEWLALSTCGLLWRT